ncbi:CLUMA_CG016422, isoform A [Clunio marinus]|uniref:CLUMA_CG016422, isoform A n=1 Tax=Clunio marinus TaxID=568069 RepID=A0A1J1IUM7_9DIPT|nr:CLUMA_CG016422, isoform A [Clunio marinus]
MEFKSVVLILSIHGVVINRDPPTTTTVFRCVGASLSDRHILTAASCLNDIPDTHVPAIQVIPATGNPTIHPVARSLRHPDFLETLGLRNNLVILELENDRRLDTNVFRGQNIGDLHTGISCNLHGFNSSMVANPGNIAVTTIGPPACIHDNDQLFCSTAPSQEICLQIFGGFPLICGEGGTINAITITNCAGPLHEIQYHNVGQFRSWIEGVVSGAESLKKLSIAVLFSTFLISLRNFL